MTTLFTSSGDLIPGTVLAAYQHAQAGQAPLETCTLVSHGSLAAAKDQTFARVCSVASLEATHPEALCSLLFKLLQPGGTLTLQQTAQDPAALQRQLLFQGFVDVQPAASLQPGGFALSARRPEWTTGARSKLALKPRPQQQKVSLPTVNLDTDMVEAPAQAPASKGDAPASISFPAAAACKPAKKACANCTCGRAASEAKGEKMTLDKLQNFSSACGSCGLGDSFRCESCPYRGQPAFDMGKKVALKSDFLTVDA